MTAATMLNLIGTQIPDTPFLTYYLLENPYPGMVLALLLAGVFGVIGYREGRQRELVIAGVAALLAIAIFVISGVVTTPAEHGKRIVRTFVEAVVEENVSTATGLVADDAVIHLTEPTNPGLRLIRPGITTLAQRYTISSNTITQLDGATTSDDTALIRLACLTEAGYGYTATGWLIEVREVEPDTWLITDITWLKLGQNAPPTDMLRVLR